MDLFIEIIKWIGIVVGSLAFIIYAPWIIFGLVIIDETQVGIIIKRFASKNLPSGKIVALKGEAGYQADTLPPGWHFGYWPWQFSIEKQKAIIIKPGTIGLIVAKDGVSIPTERILGKVVDCDNYQDARKFLENKGEKGRQLGIITAGTYRINTALFDIVTVDNAKNKFGLDSDDLEIYCVNSNKVGIVTTLDGAPIEPGEIAGPIVSDHDNFQKPQSFMEKGGRRGLQEQVLLSGTWNINPWFAAIEQVDMVEVPIGNVGVVISYVGKAHQDVSGKEFKHGDLVEVGHKGVWVTPIYPGKHPLNTKILKIELIPTTNIVLNWATRTESHKYDQNLSSITVRSKDGFSFNLDVSQIIHVGALEAPKVICRVGSMKNLVDQVLEPTIGNYFRNSAQNHTVLDFLNDRSNRQATAAEYIKNAIKFYDVEAVDTLIGDITPPAQLMQTQTDRKIAEEQNKTYAVQETAQIQRQALARETAIADTQGQIVTAERAVKVAELDAQAQINRANGESQSIALKAEGESKALESRGNGEAAAILKVGEAKAKAYAAGVQAMGDNNYALLQVIQLIADKQVKVTPDTLITGGENNNGLLLTSLLNKFSK